jgi:hypothetical protein
LKLYFSTIRSKAAAAAAVAVRSKQQQHHAPGLELEQAGH